MNGEKITIHDDELVFEKSGKIFTLRSDVLKEITAHKYSTKDSTNAKLISNFMDESYFYFHARGKSWRDRNLIKDHFKKKSYF